MNGKQITLILNSDDAATLRDALIDASLALRTNSKDVVIAEDIFFDLPISDRKRQRYLTLREYAQVLKKFCQ